MGEPELRWIDAGEKGYSVALAAGKLVCRNAKGAVLSSVPPAVRKAPGARQLEGLQAWLEEHEQACKDAVELWLLRTIAVPRALLEAVWPDPSWRRQLEWAVVAPASERGPDLAAAGLLRGVDARGLGVVTVDGESARIEASHVHVPHPVLIDDLAALRDLLADLGEQPGIEQLGRATFRLEPTADRTATERGDFGGAMFAELNHAAGRCRALGYRVRGGSAILPIWERSEKVEARLWIGDEEPDAPAVTGALSWTDAAGRALPLSAVGPVAFSEGMRMGSRIFEGRRPDGEVL